MNALEAWEDFTRTMETMAGVPSIPGMRSDTAGRAIFLAGFIAGMDHLIDLGRDGRRAAIEDVKRALAALDQEAAPRV
jgi:hypothetical protein